MLEGKKSDEFRRLREHRLPFAGELRNIRRLSLEIEGLDLLAAVPRGSAGLVENEHRAQSRVFPACRPDQVAQVLNRRMTPDNVDPIPRLHSSNEREHLVRCLVERMKRESEEKIDTRYRRPTGSASAPPLSPPSPPRTRGAPGRVGRRTLRRGGFPCRPSMCDRGLHACRGRGRDHERCEAYRS